MTKDGAGISKFIGYVLLTAGNVALWVATVSLALSSQTSLLFSEPTLSIVLAVAFQFVVPVAFLAMGAWLIRPLPLLSKPKPDYTKQYERRIARKRLRTGLVCKIFGGQMALWGFLWTIGPEMPRPLLFLNALRPLGLAMILVGACMMVWSWFWFKEFSVTDLQASYAEGARKRTASSSWGSHRSQSPKEEQYEDAKDVPTAWSSSMDESFSETSGAVEYMARQPESPIEEYPQSRFWRRG